MYRGWRSPAGVPKNTRETQTSRDRDSTSGSDSAADYPCRAVSGPATTPRRKRRERWFPREAGHALALACIHSRLHTTTKSRRGERAFALDDAQKSPRAISATTAASSSNSEDRVKLVRRLRTGTTARTHIRLPPQLSQIAVVATWPMTTVGRGNIGKGGGSRRHSSDFWPDGVHSGDRAAARQQQRGAHHEFVAELGSIRRRGHHFSTRLFFGSAYRGT